MAVTQIDIDVEALAEVMRLSGARTKKDAVNLALQEYAMSRKRLEALRHYSELARGWDYEGWQRMRAAEKDPAA